LAYLTSFCNHAMTFTGVNLVNNKPNRFKVENSWGKDNGTDGFFVMDEGWFDSYVYQAIIKKEYLPKDLVKKYEDALKNPTAVEPFFAIFTQVQ
jgi:bleomycin hydrolase